MTLKIKTSSRDNALKQEALKDVTKQKSIHMTINISKSLHTEFKIAAISNNTNMTDLIIKWIEGYVQK